jgi:hypothetical protein
LKAEKQMTDSERIAQLEAEVAKLQRRESVPA